MSNFRGQPGMVLQPAQSQAIQFTDDAGNAIVVSQADVYQFICPQATPQEVVFFMELCRAQRLNPFVREAFLIKYGTNPASMVTAEVVFERRANAHPDYEGMECGVVFLDGQGQLRKREGTATYRAAGEVLVGGWARVHRRGRVDSYAEVSLDEYNKNQSVWKSMPGVMIQKCAKGVALRLAFPSDFQGMYLQEEVGAMPTVQEVHADVVENVHEDLSDAHRGPVAPEMDLQPMQDDFNRLVGELASLRGADEGEVALAVLRSKALASTGYQVGGEMTSEQLAVAVSQAQAWLEKARGEAEPAYEEE